MNQRFSGPGSSWWNRFRRSTPGTGDGPPARPPAGPEGRSPRPNGPSAGGEPGGVGLHPAGASGVANPTGRIRTPPGLALELARRRIGFSVEAAAAEVGLTRHQLEEYESGLRTPHANVIEELADLYGVEPDLLESRAGAQVSADGTVLRIGMIAIEIGHLDNEAVCARLGSSLRAVRNLDRQSRVKLRVEELPEIARAFDLTDPNLADSFARHLTVGDRGEAETLVELLRATAAGRAALPAGPATAEG